MTKPMVRTAADKLRVKNLKSHKNIAWDFGTQNLPRCVDCGTTTIALTLCSKKG